MARLKTASIAALLATADPKAWALLAPQRSPIRHADLRSQVDAAAQRLAAAGIGRGDRVAIVLPNGPEMVTAFLAVARVATCAPLNPALRAADFEFLFDDLRAKAVILDAGLETPARAAAQARGIRVVELRPLRHEPAGTFELNLPAPADATEPDWTGPDDVALLLHTSGTTARPKSVPLTQSNLCHSACNIRTTLALEASDRCLNIMPLFHIHGLVGAVLSSIAAGASVVCTPGFVGPMFFDWLDTMEPTWLTAVPTILQAILARTPGHEAIIARRPLRFIRSSSSPLAPRVMAELEQVFGAPVIEAYGMTEASHQMASNPLPPGKRKPGSVGLPAGAEITILDEQDVPASRGAVGRVAIRGLNVTRGYESASPESSFVNGWFLTGDRGRLDDDGYLFLTGRTKEIINRGGEKIAPREIDEVLMAHPAVAQAVAFAVPDARLGEDVGAAVVLRESATVDAAALCDFAAERLADFKVPRRIVFLDEIPKGPTGKVQRIGLADALGLTATVVPRSTSGRRAPTTQTEAWLADVFAEVLAVRSVGVEDSFFDLNGDSILATQLTARIHMRTGLDLAPLRVFQLKTVQAIAAHLDTLGEATGTRETRPIAPASVLVPSLAQERLWFLAAYENHPAAYVASSVYRLTGPLNLEALNRSLTAVVARHEVLRTAFSGADGALHITVQPAAPQRAAVHDLRHLAADERDRRARQLIAEQIRSGFDLEKPPLVRLLLVRLSDHEHLTLLQMHHVATDGWSIGVFWRELSTCYEAFRQGRTPVLTPLPIQYRDYAAWQRRAVEHDSTRRQLDFWMQELQGQAPPLLVPTDYPRPARQTFDGARVVRQLPDNLTQTVKAVARGQECTFFMALLAAWEAVLFRYTGQTEFCVGTPVAGRTLLETEPLIGVFVNTLPLRADLSGTPTFRRLLAGVRRMAVDAYSNQDLPIERLIEALRPDRSLAYPPLFQVLFQLRNYAPAIVTLPDVDVERLDVDPGVALFDLALEISERPHGTECVLTYNRDLFDAPTAERMLSHYMTLLAAAVADLDRPIAELPMLSSDERHRMLVEWNRTASAFPSHDRIHQRIEAQVARTPDALAVTDGRRALTYAELDRRANQCANYLRTRGAGRQTRVGLCMDRSVDLVAALLGILKTGAAYVPVDPAYPPDWRHGVLSDAKADMIVTDETWEAPELGSASTSSPDVAGEPTDSAYVIYTSGSTGKPKGVQVPHRAVVNLLESLRQRPGFAIRETFLALAPISFDIAGAELLLPLTVGGHVWIADRSIATDGRKLAALLATSGACVMQATPATWRLLVESGWTGTPNLRAWSAGEALPRDLADQLLNCGVDLWNLYGPTETTVFSTVSHVARGNGALPIGRPIGNTTLYVLDPHGQAVPVGVPGELYIGGVGVADGYFGRPDQTAASFLCLPVPDGDHTRVYRTGDIVRYEPDGEVTYLQRLDNQVKLRGHRIELGEVESVLSQHRSVAGAVATLHEEAPGDVRLVAYLAAAPHHRCAPDILRAFVKERLPAHMVPSEFVVLDVLPLTGHGKVDRKALPAPGRMATRTDASVQPRDAMEHELVRIWQDVLGASSIGVHDDFFALGGHSLLAVRLVAKIEAALGVKVPLATLFESPTVAGLAIALGPTAPGQRQSSVVRIQPHGSGTPLFLITRFSSIGFHTLASHLGTDQPVFGLEPPGLDNRAAPIDRMEALAEYYLHQMRAVQPSGPYLIGGYSFGGFPAYEMACQLERLGERAALLLLIDSGVHVLPRFMATLPKRDMLTGRLRHKKEVLQFHAAALRSLAPSQRWQHVLDAASQRRRRRLRQRKYLELDESLPEAIRQVERANLIALENYLPGRYAGKVTVVRSTEGSAEVRRDRGWASLAGITEEHVIPGSSHMDILAEPFAPHVAALVRCLIDKASPAN